MKRLLALLAPLVACAPSDTPTWHADVRPIVEGRCLSCHTDGGVGPFALETYDHVTLVGELVAAATSSRQMPPWRAVPGDVPFAGDPSLTDAQIALIDAWVAAGMPEGDPAEAGTPLEPVGVDLPRVDSTLHMPTAYSPSDEADDDYRCFLIEWPETQATHVTGFEVRPDNGSAVHHVAAFLVRPDSLAGPGLLDTFRDFDADEEGPGYTCYGGPSGAEDVQAPIQQIAQWVPGGGATLFPQGVGIPVPPDSLVVLQVHYNTPSWDGAPDQTAVDFVLEDTVERPGAFAPFLDPRWTGGGMTIPAGQTRSHDIRSDPRAFFELMNGDIDLEDGFDIFAAMLHMHELGESAEVRLERSDESVALLAIEEWDFDWQLLYRFAEPVAFTPGDELSLECTFHNDRETDANWGEGTSDEMCVANLFIAPR